VGQQRRTCMMLLSPRRRLVVLIGPYCSCGGSVTKFDMTRRRALPREPEHRLLPTLTCRSLVQGRFAPAVIIQYDENAIYYYPSYPRREDTRAQARERKYQSASRTNDRVPKHEAIDSSKRLLSCRCNDKKVSRSPRNSGLETSASPCTRRNTLRYVWTASKSRWDFKRCERARRKRLISWTVAKERISRSAAAGDSDFEYVKNASSGGKR